MDNLPNKEHTDAPVLGTTLITYPGHTIETGVLAVAWSPDGQRIASGSGDKTVQVWDAATGGNALVYRGHASWVNAAAWSPDGRRIASAGWDDTVQVWDAVTGGNVLTYHNHRTHLTPAWLNMRGDWTLSVNAVAWSPDGQRLASGSADETVHVWDAVTGHTIFTYRGHVSNVKAVVWSPDGRHIASAGRDKTVQVWYAVTGDIIFTYHGHTKGVEAVAWSPDDHRIASASNDDTVQVWQAI